MATAAPGSVTRRNFQAKHAMWVVFGLMTLYVLATRDRTLLDSHSFLRQRYAAIPWLMLAHGVPGALALVLGVLHFPPACASATCNCIASWDASTSAA